MEKYIIYGVCNDVRSERVKKIIEKKGELLYWCDSNSDKWDAKKNIFPPKKIVNNPEATIVITSPSVKEIITTVRSLGCQNNFLVYPLLGYFFYVENDKEFVFDEARRWTIVHKEEIISLYENDTVTKYILNTSLHERLMDKPDLVCPRDVEGMEWIDYFYDDELNPKGDITLIDGGAYDGDSIQLIYAKFKNRLKKVYAFEPDQQNIARMEKNLEKSSLLDITEIVPCGMSDKNCMLRFSSSGNKVSFFGDEGDIEVPVKKIDDVIENVTGDICIKMDIEGAEVAAIKGATETIKRYSPYMAICVYHKHKDILEVPKLIKSINPNYRFYLRAGFHTECYAVPSK